MACGLVFQRLILFSEILVEGDSRTVCANSFQIMPVVSDKKMFLQAILVHTHTVGTLQCISKIKFFTKILSITLSECQTIWIQIRTDILSVLILVQNWLLRSSVDDKRKSNEPVHEISNNVVCATSKASDQPAHRCSLIRVFASCMSIL